MGTIPGARLSFPRQVVRIAFGRRKPYEKDGRSGWTTERIDHLFLAKLAERRTIGGRKPQQSQDGAGPPQYLRDPRLMEALREQHLKAECQEHCCARFSGELADWQPTWVPMYLVGPPEGWWEEGIQADLGDKWVCRASGPWLPKTDEQIDADAEALERRGLPVAIAKTLPPNLREQNVLLLTGQAQRRKVTKEQRGGYDVKLVGTPRVIECNPARCPDWWRRQKKGQVVCEEMGTLTCLFPFLSGAEQFGFWRTRGKASINRMRTTIATAMLQAGGDLTFVPLRLNLTVEPVLTPQGQHQNQPIGHLSLHVPAEEMAALMEWRGKLKLSALTSPYVGPDGLFRLGPGELPAEHERAMLPEWNPGAPEDRRPWQSRAWETGLEAGATEEQITEMVEGADSEEAFLKELADWQGQQGPQDRERQKPAEEEPIDADFTADEKPAEPQPTPLEDAGLSGALIAAREKGMTEDDIAAAKTAAGVANGVVTPAQVSAFAKQVAAFARKGKGND